MMPDNAALLLVDLQNDFCPGGALAVNEGDQVIPIANRLIPYFKTIIASQDWHPEHHMSFASSHPGKKVGDVIQLNNQQQELWPDHCVQNTKGAEFYRDLQTDQIHQICFKGTDPKVDSYSAFYDNNHLKSTGMTEWLREQNISSVYIMGLATDYCVKFSCHDAIADGFAVYLIQDGCRGVNLQPGDSDKAIAQLQSKGVHLVNSQAVIVGAKAAHRA